MSKSTTTATTFDLAAYFTPFYNEYVEQSARGCTGYIYQFQGWLKVTYPTVYEVAYLDNRKEVAEALNLKF